MNRLLRYFLLFVTLIVAVGIVSAQENESFRGFHKVKRKETIFGISHMYEISIEDLIQANPEMKEPGYELKKGTILKIPFSKGKGTVNVPSATTTTAQEPASHAAHAVYDDVRKRAIRLGVMLPLHDNDGDGRRMVEYYRGVLMACDSLKKLGISVDVNAWNASEDCDINKILNNHAAAECDLIIGPLYSKQMDAIAGFTARHDIQLVIPFSINAPQLTTNRNIFQIWQS